MSSIIQQITKSIQDVKTLPTVYTRLTEVMASTRSTIQDAAEVISSDQAAVTKILKVANSPLYGLTSRVDSINKAIFLLGFNEVKNLIVAISIMDMFNTKNVNTYFNPVEFWRFSIGVGVVTRHIGKEAGIANVDNFFLTGIIHGIGKLFLSQYASNEFLKTLEYAYNNDVALREAERKILGTTHTVVGELLAEHWKLPNAMKNAIRNYQTGMVNQTPELLTSSVHIGYIVAQALEFGNSGDRIIERPNPLVWPVLKLRSGALLDSFDSLTERYQQAISVFSL